ncbi:hypothetical protein ACO34A_19435 [Rhizobium sp. ACO-34A]|nr:hypothetical protein [Rhizobium sp. ACO-34A]ATN35982.1 hypothetical protein ACO34A_19435 [Rhizobium sp. ACO-34A]
MCQNCITHGNVQYVSIGIDDCLPLVEGFVRENRPWHSHVLSPGCAFNPNAGLYAIVVEDDSNGTTYLAPSETFPEVDKQFVKMLHGDDILDAGHPESDNEQLRSRSPLLTRLMEVDARGVAWHHHMNFPQCAFNPHPGRWAITVESGEGTFSEDYDEEPKDILRAVEVIYFGNLARAEA